MKYDTNTFFYGVPPTFMALRMSLTFVIHEKHHNSISRLQLIGIQIKCICTNPIVVVGTRYHA